MKISEGKAPGKLYIAGEYAVVEAGHPAILITVDQFLKVKLTETESSPALFSKNYTSEPISWDRGSEGQFALKEQKESFSYLISTIQTVENYVQEKGIELGKYKIEIDSQLDGDTGAKIGLGSSAAVTVALVKALLDFYSVSFDQTLVFKLAAIAHVKLNSNGSLGDLAAASYTGWVFYVSLDKVWLKDQLNQRSLHEIISAQWEQLHIEQLDPPADLNLLIGWTGSPASTTDLVHNVSQQKEGISYDSFFNASKQTVENLKESFQNNDISNLLTLIRKNRELLNQMGKETHTEIETDLLSQLCEIAEKYGAAAKSSGAGGGDCGITLFADQRIQSKIIEEWKSSDIVPLPLNIYTEN